MLAFFDPKRETILETDAPDIVTNAVLYHYDDYGLPRHIVFISKKTLTAV